MKYGRRNSGKKQWRDVRSMENLEPRFVLDSTVVLNELMYNPVGQESLEWLELHNQMSVAVELSDWTLQGGIEYRFPAGTILEGGDYLVVAATPDRIQADHGLERVLGPFSGRLSNGGERIELRNHTERLMSELNYSDGQQVTDPWDAAADGSGASLAKIDEFGTFTDAEHWAHSRQIGGTPGERNFLVAGSTQRTPLIEYESTWSYDQTGEPTPADWTVIAFDDTAWPSGPGLLYAENSGLDAEKNTPLEVGPTTFYFRSSFEFAGDTTDVRLRFNHIVDDGAIFYLNGEEVSRYRMPEGPVTHETFSSRSVSNAKIVSGGDLDPSLLIDGTNTFAVEVHQNNATSDDVVLGIELWVEGIVGENVEPVDKLSMTEVAAGGDAFWVELTNEGDDEISLDGIDLVSTTGGRHALAAGNLGANQTMVIDQASLGFSVPVGEKLFLEDRANQWIAESVLVTDHARGRSSDLGGRWQAVATPTPGEPNVFDTVDQIVINEIMYHARPTYSVPPTLAEDVVLPVDAIWRYDFSGNDPTSAYVEVDFDDSSWQTGPGVFFRENSRLDWEKRTPIPDDAVTVYFRTTFNIDEDPAGQTYAFRHLIDDGAAIYLNGTELTRFNLPEGPLTPETESSRSVSNAKINGPIRLPSELLVQGENVLAAQVHQTSPTSNDSVFAMEIVQQRVVSEGSAFAPSGEEWIELYNRGPDVVDVSGWRVDRAVDVTIPDGTTLAPGEYGVVAWNRDAMAAKHPNARILGEFNGSLSNADERIVLLDSRLNVADEVHYFEGGYWPEFADGGGASLELLDPDADNTNAGAWASSDESQRSQWQHVSYTRTVQPFVHDPPINFNEFVMGLLDTGEVLIDNLSVLELGDGDPVELIQNGSFNDDAVDTIPDKWRIQGTHYASHVTVDPNDNTNNVLKIDAVARTNYLSNHAETTLANGAEVVNGQTYQIRTTQNG